MKKFVLLHCYTELNKGDSGIIVSTIQKLREKHPNCQIDLISTFTESDTQFKEEHLFLRKFADNVYPSILGEPFLVLFNRNYHGKIAKSISTVTGFTKSLLFYLLGNLRISKILITDAQNLGVESIKNADYVISKGGSFLCSNGSIRGAVSLARLVYPIILAKKFKKNVSILAQSLGPYNSFLGRQLFKLIDKNVDKKFIREELTLDLLKKEGLEITNFELCPDMAFALKPEIDVSNFKVPSTCNIGMTFVDFKFASENKRSNYIENMRSAIEFCITKYDSNVYVFPQVSSKFPDGSEDMKLPRLIKKQLSSDVSKKFILIEKPDYNPLELKRIYREMFFFISTRLHSAIFAISEGTPAINISYHGTKSLGTFKWFDLENLVLSIHSIEKEPFIDLIESMYRNNDMYRNKIDKMLPSIKDRIHNVFEYYI